MNRKDVEALAQLLDGGLDANGEVTEEVRALAALASAMEASATRPRAEFKADLRTALIAEARQQAAGPAPLLTRLRVSVDDTVARWKYSTRLAAASGAAALALSGGGTAVAAEHALSGDVLYPVKLVLEDARLLLTRGDESRGERNLGYAARRADEARSSADAANDPGAATALREADDSTRAGAADLIAAYQDSADRAPLRTLLVFTMAQRDRVEGFTDLLGRDGGEAAADHLVTLDRIETRIAVLLGGCPECPDSFQPGVPPAASDGFDFADIPPAHEEFDPCPCPEPRAPAPSPDPTPPVTPPEEDDPAPPPSPDPDPDDDPPPPPPDEDEPIVPLPDVPVVPDEVQDPIQDTLDDILRELLEPTLEPTPIDPEDLPDLPLP
jgi:hypothetical protein